MKLLEIKLSLKDRIFHINLEKQTILFSPKCNQYSMKT